MRGKRTDANVTRPDRNQPSVATDDGEAFEIACPSCRPGRYGQPLRMERIRQGQYGNCGVCFRQMVKGRA